MSYEPCLSYATYDSYKSHHSDMSYVSLESGELCKQKQPLQKKAFEYCQRIEDACNPCLHLRPAAKPVLDMSTIAALRTFVFGNKAFKCKVPNYIDARTTQVAALSAQTNVFYTSAPTNVRNVKSRMMMEAMLPGGPRILILTRYSAFVLIYASRWVLSFLCLWFLWWCDLMYLRT